MKVLLLIAVAAVFSFSTSNAFAKRPDGKGKEFKSERVKPEKKENAFKDKMTEIRSTFSEKRKAIKELPEDQREAAMEALNAEKKEALSALREERKAARADRVKGKDRVKKDRENKGKKPASKK